MLLYESPPGVQFIREDKKKRSVVKVVNGTHILHIYRMNNIPFYEHPYLSWANLDCCGGWMYDQEYLRHAVQRHRKLVADITFCFDSGNDTENADAAETEISRLGFGADIHIWRNTPQRNGPYSYFSVIAAREGALRDYFDIDSITAACAAQGLRPDRSKLGEYFSVPLITLYKGGFRNFDFANVKTVTESIINGLALGYPIESTVSFILNMH